jgi:hypothetical protein
MDHRHTALGFLSPSEAKNLRGLPVMAAGPAGAASRVRTPWHRHIPFAIQSTDARSDHIQLGLPCAIRLSRAGGSRNCDNERSAWSA